MAESGAEEDKDEACEKNSENLHKLSHCQKKNSKDLDKTYQQQRKSSKDLVKIDQRQTCQRWLTFRVEIDVLQITLFLVALATRLWSLDSPRAVVFDELFYGRFASLYAQRTFFFDTQPPLGKLLIALGGYLAGWDGAVKLDKIGADYPPNVPVWQMRCIPAVLGSLVVPISYSLLAELGLAQWGAAMGALLVLLDTALLTQCHFMLLEGPLLCAISVCLLSYVKFKRANASDPLSVQWWGWLVSLGISLAAAISIKYSAVFTVILVLVLVTRDFWSMLALPFTNRELVYHGFVRIAVLLVLPLVLYISVFYVHLSILYKAGPHDDVMTSAFQASLEGGLAAITKGQPLDVAYGSQVTLRHTYGTTPCWLHSHNHLYPLTYPDGRGSTHQQQVTCYSFKDVNNWWIIKDPRRNTLVVDDPLLPVKHGDLVQLVHGMTSRALNSHDVAAPLSPQCQEVTCYIDYNISMATQNLWRVEILNREQEGDTWKTIQSHVRLVHINTTQALKITGKHLPDWGFHQLEVVTDKLLVQEATVWNVEEHRYTQARDATEREQEFSKVDMIPLQPVNLGFFSKLIELQLKMLSSGKDQVLEHRYSSNPLEWPLTERNVAYWYNPNTKAQIHLVGNPVIWYSGALAVVMYAVLAIGYLLRRQRRCYDIAEDEWRRFVEVGELLFAGYVVNYVPYLMTDSTLFLHHYLPALLYQVLLLPALCLHLHNICPSAAVQCVYSMLLVVWLTSVLNTFLSLQVFSYGGKSLTADDISQLKWRDSWDFITQPPFG